MSDWLSLCLHADIRECDFNKGGCEDVCINTEGSFFCDCTAPGFEATGLNCTGIIINMCNLSISILTSVSQF